MNVSPRTRTASKPALKAHLDDFAENRLRHLGYPSFGDEEIAGNESDGTVHLEVDFPGFGDAAPEALHLLSLETASVVANELTLPTNQVCKTRHR